MSSGFGGTGAGQIRYTISVDDAQAVQKLQGVGQQMTNLGNATETTTQQVQQASQQQESFGSTLRSAAFGITAAAGGIIGLVQQYTSLRRAQNTLERSQQREKDLIIAIEKQRRKYNETVEKSGKNSQEAKDELAKLQSLEAKQGILTERNEIMQEQLNQRMMDFAVNVVPTSIGVIAGLAQTFSILGVGRGGTGGIKGVLTWIGKFALPLAGLGIAVYAIKTNLFGFRDALDGVGKAIGDAIPAARPFLDFIRNIGVSIGLIPGEAGDAKLGIMSFISEVKKWGGEVKDTISKIFDALSNMDIGGAISIAKESLEKALPGVTKKINDFFEDPIDTVVSLAVGIKNWILDKKIGGLTVKQWLLALGIKWTLDFAKQGGVVATVKLLATIGQVVISKPTADIYMSIADLYAKEFNTNPVKAGIKLLTRIVDFTIIKLLPEDYAKLYLKFTQEYDRSKGANVGAVIVIDVIPKIGEILGVEQKTSNIGDQISTMIANLISIGNPFTAVSVAISKKISEVLTKPLTEFMANTGKILTDPDFWIDVGKRIVGGIIKGLTQDSLISKALKGQFTIPTSDIKDTSFASNSKTLMSKHKTGNWFTDLFRSSESLSDAELAFLNRNKSKSTSSSKVPNINDPKIKAFYDSLPPELKKRFVSRLIDARGDRDAFGDDLAEYYRWYDHNKQIGEHKMPDPMSVIRNSRAYGTSPHLGGNWQDPYFYKKTSLAGGSSPRQTGTGFVPGSAFAQAQQAANSKTLMGLHKGTGATQMNELDKMARQIVQITNNLNTFARVIVQVTKNISQWARATVTQTKDNDQLARTIAQITKNNNTYAKTIVTVTKDFNQLAKVTVQNTKNNNTFAKTIVETTKDFNTMARATNQNTKNLNTFARAVNQTTSNVKKLSSALNDIPTNVNIRIGLRGAGVPFVEHLL